MSQLQTAISQLEGALDALERTLVLASDGKAALASENGKTAWMKEREDLLARIAELEEQVRSASSTNEEIEVRLDRALGEIHSALTH
jgi:chromosome segregation ATPase